MKTSMRISFANHLRQPLASLLIAAAVLLGCTGLACDTDAQATFRQTATDAIGSGIKTIMDSIIDGMVAAVEQAGDGSSDSGTTGQ